MTTRSPSPAWSAPRKRGGIFAIVLVYAAFSSLWILLSDHAVALLFGDPGQFGLASNVKGLLFVFVTALLLNLLLRQFDAGLDRASAAVRAPALPWLSLLALAATIAILTGLGIAHQMAEQRRLEIARLQAIADLKARLIGDWLRERHLNAQLLHNSPYLTELYRSWRVDGNPDAKARIVAQLERFRTHRFGAVLLFAPDGTLLWSSDRAAHGVPPELARTLTDVARTDQMQRIGPYRDAAGRIHLDFVVPLSLGDAPGPTITLHSDPADWIYSALHTWPVPSASAETLLFRREGDAVLYLNDLRHHPDAALKLRLPLTTERLLAARLLRGEVAPGGVVEGVDYRDMPVFGVAQPVPGTDWWLLAKIDLAELHARARENAVWVALSGALLLLALGTALVLLNQREALTRALDLQRAQAERLNALAAQRSSENRFRALVEQAPAGIYILRDGQLVYVNQAFASLFGDAAPATLAGLPLTELIVPEDRARVGAELQRIVEQQTVATHFFCGGMRRDGRRVDLELHGRVFDFDEQGQPALIGFLLDISARVAAEQALRQQAEELAARKAELERFNRVSVGRELEMIALKQRVNELSRRLGQPPPFALTFLDGQNR